MSFQDILALANFIMAFFSLMGSIREDDKVLSQSRFNTALLFMAVAYLILIHAAM